jgi:hypothetical protein
MLTAPPAYCVDANDIPPILWPVSEYGSVSPLNFTVAYVQSADLTPDQKDEITEIINHWTVGMYEMTNARHKLGSVKVISVSEDVRENFHVLWRDIFSSQYFDPYNNKTISAGLGAYIPYAQQGRLHGSILFDWENLGPGRVYYDITSKDNAGNDNTLR